MIGKCCPNNSSVDDLPFFLSLRSRFYSAFSFWPESLPINLKES